MLPLSRTISPALSSRVYRPHFHQHSLSRNFTHEERTIPLSLAKPVFLCNASKTPTTAAGSTKRRGRKKKTIPQQVTENEELMKIVELLPKHLRKTLESHPKLENLLEIVMDLGRIPFARFPEGDFDISKTIVSHMDLSYAITQLGEFGGDRRAGISGTLHRISCLRNRKEEVIGLTARVGRDIAGSGEIVADIIKEGKSLLLLGYPGLGKTTAIRSMCKILADQEKKRVIIVDTSNEIGGDGDVPHPGIGRARRMQVQHPSVQHDVMIEAVENHMPQVIVIDEIGTEAECQAAATIAQRGVQLIATAHGTGLESVVKNPQLQDLIGGIESVTLGDITAKRRGVQKTALERSAPPAFDVAVEMISCNVWRVHHNLAEAVDIILAGRTAEGEIRTRTESGEISTEERKRPVPHKLPLPTTTPAREPEIPDEDEMTELYDENEDEMIEPYDPDEWTGDNNWDFFHDAVPFSASQRKSSTQETTSSAIHAMNMSSAMRLFLIGIEATHVYIVLEALGLKGQVAVTPYLKQANAVLGTRPDLRQAEWVEKAAKGAGIPLFSLQSNSNMSLAKALQSLLGLSPSTTSIQQQPKVQPCSEETKPTSRTLIMLFNTDVEEKVMMKNSDALDEVQLAIEDIVVPRNQPVDLLPQLPDIIQMQIQMVKEYDLEHQTVGEGAHTRLRIFPPKPDQSS